LRSAKRSTIWAATRHSPSTSRARQVWKHLPTAAEQLLDRMPLVEEAVALGEEVAQVLDPLPDVAADEAGFEILGQNLGHHLLGAGMTLEDRQVALQQRDQVVVAEAIRSHRDEPTPVGARGPAGPRGSASAPGRNRC
jgi:hypothetical protein